MAPPQAIPMFGHMKAQGGGHSIVKNMGSWLDSSRSGILVGKRYFWILQKY